MTTCITSFSCGRWLSVSSTVDGIVNILHQFRVLVRHFKTPMFIYYCIMFLLNIIYWMFVVFLPGVAGFLLFNHSFEDFADLRSVGYVFFGSVARLKRVSSSKRIGGSHLIYVYIYIHKVKQRRRHRFVGASGPVTGGLTFRRNHQLNSVIFNVETTHLNHQPPTFTTA